jgi:hypothetical protein
MLRAMPAVETSLVPQVLKWTRLLRQGRYSTKAGRMPAMKLKVAQHE